MSLWRCKGEQNRKIHNFIFHVGFPALKCFKNTCFTLDLEVGAFLYDMVSVSATYVQQFPSTSINPENVRKRPFLYGRGHNFVRDSCFAMNDILCARPISSLSNGVYLMSLRPSVAEQSVRDPSGVGPFFRHFRFFHYVRINMDGSILRRHKYSNRKRRKNGPTPLGSRTDCSATDGRSDMSYY